MNTRIITQPDERGKHNLPATREACRTRTIQLQSEIAAIRDQIAATDLARQANGGHMDALWYHRARTAIRFKREELAHLQEHYRTLPGRVSERKEQLKECILAVVRTDYSDEEWHEVMDDAHRLLLNQAGA